MLLTPPKCSAISRTTTSDSVENLDRQLDASDTYLALAHGQPVNSSELAHAIGDLTDVARQAPSYPLDNNQISRTEWTELLEPVTQRLRDRGIELEVGHHIERHHPGLDLGL